MIKILAFCHSQIETYLLDPVSIPFLTSLIDKETCCYTGKDKGKANPVTGSGGP
jgi:hypothetical protein